MAASTSSSPPAAAASSGRRAERRLSPSRCRIARQHRRIEDSMMRAMRQVHAVVVIIAVLLFSIAISGQGRQGGGRQGAGPPRVRARKLVLAWADTRNGIAQHDSTSHALSVIERLGYESGVYDTYIRTDSNIIANKPLMTTGQPASGGPSLANVDAIFFMGHRDVPLDPQQRTELAAFVHDQGKGFVAAHVALTAFEGWPEFGELIGGRYDEHPWNTASGTVINEDPSFP